MKFAQRSTEPERMESELTAYEDYARCLADLPRVNRLTLTHRPVLAWLARQTRGLTEFSLLDVGSGEGDLLRLISAWAARRGLAATLAGVDMNPLSTRAAQAATGDKANGDTAISFHTANVLAFAPPQRFDFIVSSQFVHHLTDEQVAQFLQWQEAHAASGWFISDLHRHWLPYYAFGVIAWAAGWHRLIRSDGQISVARGFTPAEWRQKLAEAGITADVRWHIPFRLGVGRTLPPAAAAG